MGGGQTSGDSSLNVSAKPEQGPLGGVLDALGFHPQSYPGAMEGTWLSRSGRTEVLWDPREPHNPAPQKHLPKLGVYKWVGWAVRGLRLRPHSLLVLCHGQTEPQPSGYSYCIVSCLGGSICTTGRTALPISSLGETTEAGGVIINPVSS